MRVPRPREQRKVLFTTWVSQFEVKIWIAGLTFIIATDSMQWYYRRSAVDGARCVGWESSGNVSQRDGCGYGRRGVRMVVGHDIGVSREGVALESCPVHRGQYRVGHRECMQGRLT